MKLEDLKFCGPDGQPQDVTVAVGLKPAKYMLKISNHFVLPYDELPSIWVRFWMKLLFGWRFVYSQRG